MLSVWDLPLGIPKLERIGERGDIEKRRPSLGSPGGGGGVTSEQSPRRGPYLPALPSRPAAARWAVGPAKVCEVEFSVVSSCPNIKGDSGLMGQGPGGAPV